MKAKIEIYSQTFEIEIKARDTRNLNASKKATQEFTNWLIWRLKEAKQFQDSKEYIKEEINNVIKAISNNI